jgi:hypothetical protein
MRSAGRILIELCASERIGSWVAEPTDLRGLAIWLSPADVHRLVEASLTCRDPGFKITWGISRNTRGWVSLTEGEEIGYHPQDDAGLR